MERLPPTLGWMVDRGEEVEAVLIVVHASKAAFHERGSS
jgi:hypothetical protein